MKFMNSNFELLVIYLFYIFKGWFDYWSNELLSCHQIIFNESDHGTSFLVHVSKTKTKVARQFSITGSFYDIGYNYINLSPSSVTTNAFFLNFQKGKYTVQTIGINKFRLFGKVIATYLKLPNPEKYTRHCLRRSSTTIFTVGSANTIDLKIHGGWK